MKETCFGTGAGLIPRLSHTGMKIGKREREPGLFLHMRNVTGREKFIVWVNKAASLCIFIPIEQAVRVILITFI